MAEPQPTSPPQDTARPVILIGNPNTGKSSIFGLLTGQYVTVSNYPGTTVEITRGTARRDGQEYAVIDTPGTNNLIPASEDEQVARDILLDSPGARVIQVAEMKNIQRGVLLALQLAELEIPFVLDLNMSDEARSRGISIEIPKLSALLGVDVVETIAVQRKGVDALWRGVTAARRSPVRCAYSPEIEAAAARIEAMIPAGQAGRRGLALMLLAGDETLATWAEAHLTAAQRAELQAIRRQAAGGSQQGLRYRINKERLAFVQALLRGVVTQEAGAVSPLADAMGRYAMHPVWGFPVLAAVLLVAYYFVGVFGAGTLVDLLESSFFGSELVAVETAVPDVGPVAFDSREPGKAALEGDVRISGTMAREAGTARVAVDAAEQGTEAPEPAAGYALYWYAESPAGNRYDALVPDPAVAGRFTAELPEGTGGPITIRAWSGYVNRYFYNAIFRWVPVTFVRELIVGPYGVVTMAATYAIAIVLPIVGVFFIFFSLLEDSGYLPRLAIMVNRLFKRIGLNGKAVLPMVLGLGCDTMATMTARIMETTKERIIVTLLLALAVPCSAQLGVILGMLSGLSLTSSVIWAGAVVGVLFLVGYLAAKVIPGGNNDFIMEVTPLRMPQMGNIVIKTAGRIEWYLREAVPLFVVGTLFLFALDKLKVLGAIEDAGAPLIQSGLGLPREATAAFLVGFLRRDYGAAGLFALFAPAIAAGQVTPELEVQIVVSMVTITLFVPCVANVLVMVKERGLKTAMAMVAFIFPFAFGVGTVVNWTMRAAYGL